MTPRKLILWELNEVPYRVLDDFIEKHPKSALATHLHRFAQYETLAQDGGELSPWVTWPSLHRGVSNHHHGLRDINQGLTQADEHYPPLWRILKSQGLRIGIFGSLHSFPLPQDAEQFAFYVPDPFSTSPEVYPKTLESFQNFNLQMSRQSARNVSSNPMLRTALPFLMGARSLGLKPRTMVSLLGQLAKEARHPWIKIRRRTYQSVLGFDLFMKQLEYTQPDFSTFFTNHVASSMHRYWAAAFPEDYDGSSLDPTWVKQFSKEIDFAMGWVDRFATRLIRFVNTHPHYRLIIASSMGQNKTTAEHVHTQLYPKDLPKFLKTMGLTLGSYRVLACMFPQYNVSVTQDFHNIFAESLRSLKIHEASLSFRQHADVFSIDFGQENLHVQNAQFRGKSVSLEDLGLDHLAIEDKIGATAYHIPQGILLSYDPQHSPKVTDRRSISALDLCPSILQSFHLTPHAYMQPPHSIPDLS